MSRVTIRPATAEDAIELSARLRDADLLELCLTSLMPPSALLSYSVSMSLEAWVGVGNGKVIAVGGFGIYPGSSIGIPWLVGSPEVLKHPVQLVKVGREMVAKWSPLCSLMSNYVHKDNHVAIEWLKRIGFSMGPVVPYGPFSSPFIKFYRKTQCVDTPKPQ